MTVQSISQIIIRQRLPLNDEKALQVELAKVFADNGIEAKREVRLGVGDIIDFMIGDIGMEVKIKGGRRAIYHQCERYCRYPEVKQFILLTNVPMGFPPEIDGTSCFVISLARAWM